MLISIQMRPSGSLLLRRGHCTATAGLLAGEGIIVLPTFMFGDDLAQGQPDSVAAGLAIPRG
jgi:hypothetical protein